MTSAESPARAWIERASSGARGCISPEGMNGALMPALLTARWAVESPEAGYVASRGLDRAASTVLRSGGLGCASAR